MWNLGTLTHQLGDAFEKVRKEVESFGAYDDDAHPNASVLTPHGIVDDVMPRPLLYAAVEEEVAGGISPRINSLVDSSPTEETTSPQKASSPTPQSHSMGEEGLTEGEATCEGSQGGCVGAEGGVDDGYVRVQFDTVAEGLPQRDSPKNSRRDMNNDHLVSSTELQQLLEIREVQLQAQSAKLLELQERNEQLEKSALAISQEEHDAMRHQYEERLRNAEHRIYTIARERDALKRGSGQDSHKDAIIREKDEIIEDVMAEGQRLSKKQMDLENSIRKKAALIRELEDENEELKEKLAEEVQKCEQLSFEKRQLMSTLQETETQQKQQLEIQRVQFEKLLEDASAAQAHADQAAKEAAKEGLLQRVQEADSRNDILSSHVEALHAEMEIQKRQTEAAEARWKQEMASLEKRCHEAETRHEELLVKFPDATKPLLIQLEALQTDIDSKSEAWAAAERALMEELESAEDALRSAETKEQSALLQLKELMTKHRAMDMEFEKAKGELSEAHCAKGEVKKELEQAREALESTKRTLGDHMTESERLKMTHQQVLEQLQGELSTERMAKLSAEMELRQLQIEHQKQSADLEAVVKGNEPHAKIHRGESIVEELSVFSEATDRDTDAYSARSAVISKQYQVDRLQKQLHGLEKTREHLSAELVSVTQRAQKAESSLTDFEKAKQELSDLQSRYASAIELLGEREEQVEELRSDLDDFKQMYRDQIAYVAEQLRGTKP